MARRRYIEDKIVQAEWWDSHETVTIRSLRAEDEDWIQDRLAEVPTKKGKKRRDAVEEVRMQLNLGKIRRLTLEKGIASWTFTDEKNFPLALTPQNLRDLDSRDAEFIYQEISDLNEPASEEEKKDSLKNADSGIVESPPVSLSWSSNEN